MKNMKKLSAWLLVLVLALSMSAIAEPAAETVLYENAEFGFSIELPADWTLMDKTNIDSILETIASGDSGIEGMDVSSISAYAEQIKSTNMAMAIAPGGMSNVNVVMQDIGMAITADQFVTMIIPSVAAQYQSMFADCATEVEANVASYGGNDYCVYGISYTAAGMTGHLLQGYISVGTSMYCLSFTYFNDAEAGTAQFESLMNSLSFTADAN